MSWTYLCARVPALPLGCSPLTPPFDIRAPGAQTPDFFWSFINKNHSSQTHLKLQTTYHTARWTPKWPEARGIWWTGVLRRGLPVPQSTKSPWQEGRAVHVPLCHISKQIDSRTPQQTQNLSVLIPCVRVGRGELQQGGADQGQMKRGSHFGSAGENAGGGGVLEERAWSGLVRPRGKVARKIGTSELCSAVTLLLLLESH